MAFKPISEAAEGHVATAIAAYHGCEAEEDALAAAAARGATRGYHAAMVKRHVIRAIDHADLGGGADYLAEVLAAALDTVGGGAPRTPLFEVTRADAEWWADIATPIELEVYAAAALRRIERITFAPRARKRLFVALWESMEAEDRKRFLARVDPDGQFTRGAA